MKQSMHVMRFALKERDHSKFAWLECRETHVHQWHQKKEWKNSCVCFNMMYISIYIEKIEWRYNNVCWWFFHFFICCVWFFFYYFCFLIFFNPFGKTKTSGFVDCGVWWIWITWKKGVSVFRFNWFGCNLKLLCNHFYLTYWFKSKL